MRKALLFVIALFVLVVSHESSAQQRQISGTVISGEDNFPLPGVNILVKGTTRGAITDLDGKYSIQAGPGETLVFICWFCYPGIRCR